ncbi:protein phosphatase 1 regulatory subunit 37 [Stegostoma tigrinum]|uniref:protein phosphatase 1 regulatory subunit 37 n=1 Tax=Stegostoma tigrinum TaxID=3053191 RepID=UPI002870821B|nr:protein phosphatase 1 regulatory subunit 37 [Stegostoma tigrinum]
MTRQESRDARGNACDQKAFSVHIQRSLKATGQFDKVVSHGQFCETREPVTVFSHQATNNEMSATENAYEGQLQTSVLTNNVDAKDVTTVQQDTSLNNGLKAKPKKHVSFPSGGEIVSGSAEPWNPWEAAGSFTADEIITSYKLSCEKLGVQPIHKLLTQLQNITEVHHRIKCLYLKGEKLDYERCEALEEIFKRIQFKLINLEWVKLDENGASALFDIMEYYDSAVHLNISFTKHIGSRGWVAAAQLIRKSSSLKEFAACGIPLTERNARSVAQGLKFNNHLRVLRLDNASISGRPLMLLVSALNANQMLQELYLADNKLNSIQDSMYLRELLQSNCTIRLLDLKNNSIFNTGLEDICEGLRRQKQGLKTLILWNNRLTHKGMSHLAAILPKLTCLETLNLGHNPLSDEGILRLKEALIANRSVVRLGLASTAITCEGAVATAEFIVESARILRLDLRRNRIRTGGLMALSLALRQNHSLVRLDLDKEPLGETEEWLIETQKLQLVEILKCCKRNLLMRQTKMEEEKDEDKKPGPSF